MISVTSSNPLNNFGGFVNQTVFNFTVNLKNTQFFQKVEFFWGDGSTKETFEQKIVSKTFKKTGKFNVKAIVYFIENNNNEANVNSFIEIEIDDAPNKIFDLSRTVRKQSDKSYAKITEFTFTPIKNLFGTNLEKISYIRWDFGNNAYSNKKIVERMRFDSAGTFNVQVLIHTEDNNTYTDNIVIAIEEYINESIRFTKVPPPTYAGHLNRYPFEIEITSPVTNKDHYIDLYAQFSKSYSMLDHPTKYSFLRPQWYFLNTRLNPIREIKAITKERIFLNAFAEKVNSGGIFVGVKKVANFYFVDDWFNQDQIIKNEQPTTLWATLRKEFGQVNKPTDSLDGLHPIHANSTAQAFVPYVTLWREPDKIKFTRNGVNPFGILWENSSTPLIISVGYKDSIFIDKHNKENSIKLADRDGGFAHYLPVSKDEKIPLNVVFSNNFSTVTSFFVPAEQPFINYEDNDKFLSGGYYKTVYKYPFSGTINLSANIEYSRPNLEANNYNPLLWLLNPIHGDVNIAQYVFTNNPIINNPQYFTSTSIDTYNDLFKQNKIPVNNVVKKNPNMDTAFVLNKKTKLKPNPHASSILDNKKGLNGLCSVAALNFPTYHAWVSDSELDRLYRITSDGKDYIDINLKNFDINITPNNWGPNNLVIDGKLNVFVSLIHARHILKLDDDGNLKNFVNLGNIIPVSIDTDKNNNLYVSGIDRSQTKQSVLIKYDNNLNHLQTRTFTNNFIGNILVSPNNKVYVINQGHYNKDLKQNYDLKSFISILDTNNLNIIQNLQEFPAIKYMALDKEDNLYFNHSYNKITKISKSNKFIKTIDIITVKKNDTTNKTIIGGLAYNLNNRLYVLNSLDNTVHVLDSNDNLNQESLFYINPSNVEYKLDSFGQISVPYQAENSQYSLSLKSDGDFSGWKWSYKYSYTKGLEKNKISSQSGNIWFSRKNNFKFFGINENFDMAKYMYDFSFMKSLKESPFLYNDKLLDSEIKQNIVERLRNNISTLQNDLNNPDLLKTDEEVAYLQNEIDEKQQEIINVNSENTKGFFGSIFGSYPYEPDDIGVSTYSKIANFVSNTSDIDTCDIKHLSDISNMVDFQDGSPNINFPLGISRIVDYASISPFKLMGIKCNCGDVFKYDSYEGSTCSYCGREKTSNKGDVIDSLNYNVTAGDFFVLRFLNSKNKYRKISTGLLDNKNVYTISELMTSIGLPFDWRKNYVLYKYVPTPKDVLISNVVNLTAFDVSSLNKIYSNISKTSAELIVNEMSFPTVSTINYAITSFVFFSTFDSFEWNNYTKQLLSRTILNLTTTTKGDLSCVSFFNETSSKSLPLVTELDFSNNFNSIKNIEGYNKHNVITNKLSAVRYKTFFPLNKNYRIENYIDWNNPQTSLNITENSNEWYKNNGIMDRMINFELQKGLGLI